MANHNRSNFHRHLTNRASGLSRLTNFKNYFRRKYGGGVNLSLDENIDIKTNHHNGNTTCLDLESIEGRYLLSGAVDGHVSIYDLASVDNNINNSSSNGISSNSIKNVEPLVFSKGSLTNPLPAPHKHMISSVQWYPVDTGLFISSCMGGLVNVWDTNNMEIVARFRIGRRINASPMSRISKHHNLIAVGCDENTIRLCDLRTGSNTHVLQGHREEVSSLNWSPVDEYVVASGSNDCTVRLWDIRSSGLKACTYIFDMYDTKGTRNRKIGNQPIGGGTSSNQHKEDHLDNNNNNNNDNNNNTNNASSSSSSSSKKRQYANNVNQFQNNNRNRKKNKSNNFAHKRSVTSHPSPVKSVQFTPDGLFLVSCSSNNITTWDAYKGINQLIHYPNFKAAYCGKASPLNILQIGSSYDAYIVTPIDKTGEIFLYKMHDGTICSRLKGHYETVTDIVIRDVGSNIQLFSAALDGNILAWS